MSFNDRPSATAVHCKQPAATLGRKGLISETSMRYVQAVLAILGMIVTWVAMSELLQELDVGAFMKTWFIHSGYSILLIPAGFIFMYRRKQAKKLLDEKSKSGVGCDIELANNNNFTPIHLPSIRNPGYAVSMKQLFKLCALLTVLLTAVAWTWYVSLRETTVAANNSIYQSAPAFVFIFSVILVKESITIQKIGAVTVSIVGIILISIAPQGDSNAHIQSSTWGYVLVIISTVTYALYEVIYKKYVEHDECSDDKLSESSETINPQATLQSRSSLSPVQLDDSPLLDYPYTQRNSSESLSVDGSVRVVTGESQRSEPTLLMHAELSMVFLGVMGLMTAILLLPLFPLLHISGIERFHYPSSSEALSLFENAMLDSAYNMLLLYGIALTSPLFMAVGTMLVAPASILADWQLHGTNLAPEATAGVVLVLAGFLLLKLPLENSPLRQLSEPRSCTCRTHDFNKLRESDTA